MVCDNDQSSSDTSAVLETSVEHDNANSQRPLGTGVGYASPTNISPEIIPVSKNKFKKIPPVSETEVTKTANSSEPIGNVDSTRAVSSTTDGTTTVAAVDTTAKSVVSTTPNVSA